jgi:ribA/ribD-fused uncharacterized protein
MEIFDVAALTRAIEDGWRAEFLFFWGHTSKTPEVGQHVLSQWWPAGFSVGGEHYPTAEHYMMAEKAGLFGDEGTRARILATGDPAAAKALGRSVKGFDEQLWAAYRFEIVVRASTAKFVQNPGLGAWLVGTGDMVLVEASPKDAIWGIGLSANDARALDPRTWRGLNLLGFALMQARAELRSSR